MTTPNDSWVDESGPYPTLPVEHRMALIDMAKEELAVRKARDCFAQTCLEKERRRQGRSVEDVARAVGCRPGLLSQLERNETPFTDARHVELIAAWFHELGLGACVAGHTYRRTVRYYYPERRNGWEPCRAPKQSATQMSESLKKDQPDLEARAAVVEAMVDQLHEVEDRQALATLPLTPWAKLVARRDLVALRPFLQDVAWAVLGERKL